MFSILEMRIKTFGRKKLLLLLIIPLIFIITVLTLNVRLLNAPDLGNKPPVRSRLVARQNGRASAVRFKPSKYLAQNDVMDKYYDPEQLVMFGIVKTKEDEDIKNNGDQLYSFNDLINSRLSLNRAIPDTRHELCKAKQYGPNLPKASVIICFYNEAWSTLLRTVHSVINRTPDDLLYEIVLVDDSSELVHLQNRLAEYIWGLHPRIKLVRTPDREGLIRARMYGAEVATGEVLVFLDSHCEVNTLWLEPLLAKVASSSRTVAIPVIDIINPDTFEYSASPLVKGGFNWGMHFKWEQLPADYFKDENSYVEPIETPTMAGGLFAINRQFFRKMGEYDRELDTWGGENLEISFRMWQCGGRLEIVPCSRVGHIFRKRRPYGSPSGGDTLLRNSVRVARVWMDDYIQHFFQTLPSAAAVDYGNITERVELRKSLNCRPFQWYLKFIYPELEIPGENGRAGLKQFPPKHQITVVKSGQIINTKVTLCIQSQDDPPAKGSLVYLATCETNNPLQMWQETEDRELMLTKKLCLDVADSPDKVSYARLMKCHGNRGSQAWVWSIRNMVFQLYNPGSGRCLVAKKEKQTFHLVLSVCASDPLSGFKMLALPG